MSQLGTRARRSPGTAVLLDMQDMGIRYGLLALTAVACASPQRAKVAGSTGSLSHVPPAPANYQLIAGGETPPSPPDLSKHRLIAEGEIGPSRAELLPYVKQRPLVRVFAVREAVVFADGLSFLTEPQAPIEDRFRRAVLTAERLALLRGALSKLCPSLRRSRLQCSESSITSVTCNLDSIEFVGIDCCDGRGEGRSTFEAGRKIVEIVSGAFPPVRDSQDVEWFSRVDIERTLSPVHWKKYEPPSEPR